MRSTSMRPFAWRQFLSKRTITTKPASWANIQYELETRPPRIYYDHLTPTHSHLLDISLPIPSPSLPASTQPAALPPGHHLVYFPPDHPTTALLPDGTDADHSPGAPFTRRVWASGEISFSPAAPGLVLDGRRAVCVEYVRGARLTGAPPAEDTPPGTGEKVFVEVERLYGGTELVEQLKLRQREAVTANTLRELTEHQQHVAVVERRTLCFMTPKTEKEAKLDVEEPYRRILQPPSRFKAEHTTTLTVNAALLFRFSALSFNAHAIHLDRHHCRAVEGYHAPLVHGPLLVTLLFRALRDAGVAQSRSLKYQILAPVYVDEEVFVHVGPSTDGQGRRDVWVTAGPTKRLCVRGQHE